MIIVSDTSAISNLFQIGRLDILLKLFSKVTITPAVQRELYAIPEQRNILESNSWIEVQTPKDQKLVYLLRKKLDLGESEAIALAIETKAEYLIIDEFLGRQEAEKRGVKIVGILGILIQAKQRGIISLLKPIIIDLKNSGFRLNENLIKYVLEGVGEL